MLYLEMTKNERCFFALLMDTSTGFFFPSFLKQLKSQLLGHERGFQALCHNVQVIVNKLHQIRVHYCQKIHVNYRLLK